MLNLADTKNYRVQACDESLLKITNSKTAKNVTKSAEYEQIIVQI